MQRHIRFSAGKSDVRPAARAFLRELHGNLAGVRTLTCTGYTDVRGPGRWNRALAHDRAKTVCAVLARNLDVKAIVRSGGESHPVSSNAHRAGRAKNRRVEVVLTY